MFVSNVPTVGSVSIFNMIGLSFSTSVYVGVKLLNASCEFGPTVAAMFVATGASSCGVTVSINI